MATIAQDKPGPLLEWRKKKAGDIRGLERREFAVAGLEIREKDSDTWIISGWASVTDRYYSVGFYEERVRRSAFKRTLNENPDVQFLVNHTDLPLARTLSGTLELEERTVPDADGKTGLWFDAEVDKLDPDAQRLERKIRRGDINAASFAFQVTDQEWSDDFTKRDIISLSLARGDVSVVNQGANPYATVSVRSQDAALALADLGNEVIVAALTEWRDFTLLPLERREGKTISAATREVLSNVAGMIDDAGELLDDLLAVSTPDSDEAGDSVERSIINEKGLCAAIRAVIREPDRDERRAEIIKRAAELELPGMIPDGWAATGALAEGRALDSQEQRETYQDTLAALQGAVEDKFCENGDYWYAWVQDFTDTDVIFYAGGDLWSAPYTLIPGGAVTVGDAVGVRPVTEYVQTGETEADEPAEVEMLSAPLPDYTTRAKQEYDLLMLREGRR